jgi:putative endonuclease
MQPAVYIETNRPHGTLYIGVTSSLPRRHEQHAMHRGSAFTQRYKLTQLVFYELHPTMPQAIAREKALKNLPRARKIRLIQAMNPNWQDLSSHLQDLE